MAHLRSGPGAAPWTAKKPSFFCWKKKLDFKTPGFQGVGGLGNNKKPRKAAVFAKKKSWKKRKRVVGPLVLQELLMSSVSWSSKSQKLHSSLPSKQHGMCLPTASLSKHEDCTNTAITCCLHNFCCRMFVNPLVAGSMSKCLVKLEGMMTSNEVNHSGSGENPSCLCPGALWKGEAGTQVKYPLNI